MWHDAIRSYFAKKNCCKREILTQDEVPLQNSGKSHSVTFSLHFTPEDLN